MRLVRHSLVVVVEAVLRLGVRLRRQSVHRWYMLSPYCLRDETSRWPHVEPVVADRQVAVWLLDGVHITPADVLAGNDARLVLEGDAVVGAFGYEVGMSLARGVEKVQLLPPIAFALRLGAVIARRFRLVTFEMALSARQAAGARALGLAVGCRIALALLRGRRPTSR